MNRPRLSWLTASGEKWEGRVQAAIMLTSGGWSAAASWTHVASVAAAHGQGGWLAWADAASLELLSVAAGLDMRRRRRRGKATAFPACVLVAAVALSVGAQLVQAEQSFVGWLAAACPAGVFLIMVKMTLGRMSPVTTPDTEPAVSVSEPAVSTPATPPVSVTPTAPTPPRVPDKKPTVSKPKTVDTRDTKTRLSEILSTGQPLDEKALALKLGVHVRTVRRGLSALEAEKLNGHVPDLTTV